MVADGESSLVIWSIFYHFFLDDASLGLLLAQCRKLVQISNDMQTWRASKYGGFLRFCTDHTLGEIRRHWILYLEMETMPGREKIPLKNNFISGMRAAKSKPNAASTSVNHAVNAAGPLALEIIELAPKHFREFWSTGVTVGTSAQSKPCPHLNPTFVYSASGTKFNVHYGTDPVSSFHLAPILTSIKDTKRSSSFGIKDLVEGARQQFFSLCSSLKDRLSLESAANLTIRFFVGDALAFCRALYYCGEGNLAETGIYTYPWGGSQIDFNVQDYSQSDTRSQRAPLIFNVIDTSNLTDHLGLINILVLTVPLLRQSSASTIYTNTLLNTDTNDTDLVSKAYADIPTLALFLGVAPLSNLSLFTTHSDKHSMLFASQFPQSISWKFPLSFSAIPGTTHDIQISNTLTRLVCDTRKLAAFLLSVYRNIFAAENGMELLKNPSLVGQSSDYTRNSFVALLGFVKVKAPTDWDQVIGFFIEFIESDASIRKWLHHYQDLLCQLHLFNLFTVDTLRPSFVERLRHPQDRFHGWKDVPPVVCVLLKVPRQNIKILEDMDPDQILTPSLECRTSGPNFLNVHSSLQFVFGNIERSVPKGESAVKILEDHKGWEGCSDLIVTFYVPSWILLGGEPKSVTIGLYFHESASISLRAKLGLVLEIYSTTLMDTEHLQLVRERPGNVGELDRLRTITSVPISKNKSATEVLTTVGFDKSGRKASTLTMRHVITAPNAQKSLSNLASVTMKPLSDSILEMTFDRYKHLFINPFPVHSSQSKTRIARKSSYIEVCGRIRSCRIPLTYYNLGGNSPQARLRKLPRHVIKSFSHLSRGSTLQSAEHSLS